MEYTLSPEGIAKRYASRPGCRFVGYQEVGIAVFVMEVRVVLLDARPIPPIDEFLLRSISLDVQSPSALADLLGLDPRTVHNRLVELRRAELIEVYGDADDESTVRCRLTLKGRETNQNLERVDYTEETINVTYHGFLRKPILIPLESLWRRNEVEEKGIPVVRAIPSRYPRPDEISIEDLTEVIRRKKRKGVPKPPMLISVRSVLKGVKTLFLPAVLLQYELQGAGKQRQIAFAVDGVTDDEYERGFAACGGPEKLPDLLMPTFKTAEALASEYIPPHIRTRLGSLEGVDDVTEKLEVASEAVSIQEMRLKDAERPDTRQVLREELERQRARQEELERDLARRQARRLRAFDCARLLTETLEKVRQRLVIISAFLSTDAVDRHFLRRLEDALKRGAKLWIGYGMGQHGERQQDRERSRDWINAETALQQMQKRFREQFRLADFGNTHAKILIRDSDFVVSGSYNWLSYKANPKSKKVRDEDALMVTNPELVELYFQEIVGRFT